MPELNPRKRRRVGDATFQPVITSSSWANAFQAAWDRALKAHGQVAATSGWSGRPAEAPPGMLIVGTTAPRITNGEAVALIRAFRQADPKAFGLWYAYAAVAYGWDPPDRDELDATPLRANGSYVPDVAVALWMELFRVSKALDAANVPARLAFDGEFSDVSWVAMLKSSLEGDGAEALFKIPTGACIDGKTGKRRLPRVPCDDKGEFRDPFTGAKLACDKPGDCKPDFVDDPVTAFVKLVWPLVAVVAAIWLFADNNPRRARRYREN